LSLSTCHCIQSCHCHCHCHGLIHGTISTLIHMKLMPISPRAYIKLYCQHHHHMPVPSMYQDHHIPSQDMCLNQVPTCTMHQSIPQPVPSTMYHNTCINHAPYLYHTRYQSCTIPSINHVPYHVSYCVPTMHINHVHQHYTMYQQDMLRK